MDGPGFFLLKWRTVEVSTDFASSDSRRVESSFYLSV